MPETSRVRWGPSEDALVVDAYLDILGRTELGFRADPDWIVISLSKDLAPRTVAAVERRMQAISAVLERDGQPYLHRFRPRTAVGTGVEVRLREVLAAARAKREGWDRVFAATESAARPVRVGDRGEEPVSQVEPGGEWTDAELDATAEAYLAILAAESRGELANKRESNRNLRVGQLAIRTHAAVEWRMQNISRVLQEMGRPWVQGYKPAAHVGEVQKARIRAALARVENREPTADPLELERRTAQVRAQRRASGDRAPPEGQQAVTRTAAMVVQFYRDPDVVAWVLETAGGVCEGCSLPAPFRRSDGEPFLEVHHVRPLGEGGPDRTDNAVGLCPNCHRRLHHGADKVEFRVSIIERFERLTDYPAAALRET